MHFFRIWLDLSFAKNASIRNTSKKKHVPKVMQFIPSDDSLGWIFKAVFDKDKLWDMHMVQAYAAVKCYWDCEYQTFSSFKDIKIVSIIKSLYINHPL